MASFQNKKGSWQTSVIVACIGIGLLLFLSHIQSKRKAKYDTLAYAVSRMKIGFEKNVSSRAIPISSDIPTEYWPASVKDLNPVRVYILNHVMIVLNASKGGESGLMVVSDLSSSRPEYGSQYETYNLRKIGRNIYRYHLFFE